MKKLLIVEDNTVIGDIYRRKFQTAGYAVELTVDGESALASLQQALPDLVLLDLMLPGINGLEVIKCLRAQPAGATVPLIVFSNTYLPDTIKAAMQAGATECLSKSAATPQQLIELAQRLTTTPSAAPEAPAPPAAPAAPAGDVVVAEVTAEVVVESGVVELRASLVQDAERIISQLRESLRHLARPGETDPLHRSALAELYRNVHALTGHAGLADFPRIAQLGSLLEALLKEIENKAARPSASTLRTIAQAVDLIGPLFVAAPAAESSLARASVLVLDDDKFCRQAVRAALGKAGLQGQYFEHPATALEVASENTFDLMFLDIEMPGANGFEVCEQLRQLPHHRRVPVVFVTSLTDFDTRTRSVLSGGNDLIAKPFLMMELALKAVTYLIKQQIQPPEPVPA